MHRIVRYNFFYNYGRKVIICLKITDAEAILIGAGAGLSTSAGFTYSGERFEKYFSDFRAKYGFTDMYSDSFFCPFFYSKHRILYADFFSRSLRGCLLPRTCP